MINTNIALTQLNLFETNIDNTSISYNFNNNRQNSSRAVKTLWIKPEDSLSTLFERTAKYIQSQKIWTKNDFADSIRFAFDYLPKPNTFVNKPSVLGKNYQSYSVVNSSFLSKTAKDTITKHLDLKGVHRIMNFPTPTSNGIYVVLQSSRNINLEEVGTLLKDNKNNKFIILDSDKIIGKVEIFKQFGQYIKKLNIARNASFNTHILDMVITSLFKGLLAGKSSNLYHNYSFSEEAVNSLSPKRNNNYMNLNNWNNYIDSMGFAYKLFARYIIDNFPHAVKSDFEENTSYINKGSSILYVLKQFEYERFTDISNFQRRSAIQDKINMELVLKPFSNIKFETKALKNKTDVILYDAIEKLVPNLPIIANKPSLIFTNNTNSYDYGKNEIQVAVDQENGISVPEFIIEYGKAVSLHLNTLVNNYSLFEEISYMMQFSKKDKDKSFGIALEMLYLKRHINTIMAHKAKLFISDKQLRAVFIELNDKVIEYFSNFNLNIQSFSKA